MSKIAQQHTVAEWSIAIAALTAAITECTDPGMLAELRAERLRALTFRDHAWLAETYDVSIDESLAIVAGMPARRPLATVTDIRTRGIVR